MNDDNTKGKNRLIVDRQSPALKAALWRLIDEAKQDGGVLAPVTVVGPSQYANLSLRQELGQSGFVNVRFVLFPMLAELLGGAAMARADRRPLTPVLENVLVRDVLEQAEEPLGRFGNTAPRSPACATLSASCVRSPARCCENWKCRAACAERSSAFTSTSENGLATAGMTLRT